MAKKSVTSFIRRCKYSVTARTGIVDERTKVLLAGNKGQESFAAMEGLKLALFYTALPEKATLTPIPTLPPSPPKDKFETTLDEAEPHSGSCSLRPISTQSLPPVVSNRPSLVLSPLHSLPPSPHLPFPPSPPSSPKTESEHARFAEESTLDRGLRSSVRTSSPCACSSAESESEEEESKRRDSCRIDLHI